MTVGATPRFALLVHVERFVNGAQQLGGVVAQGKFQPMPKSASTTTWALAIMLVSTR